MIFLGDIHGNFQTIVNFTRREQSDVVKHLIQLGDFGAGFSLTFLDDMVYLNQLLFESNTILYVIRGNHDNPAYFNGDYVWSNLKLLKDYTVLNIEGYNVLFVGGAISIDRVIRKPGISWWEDEVFVYNENMINSVGDVDIVVTHNSPDMVFPKKFNQLVYSFANYDPNLLNDLRLERQNIRLMYELLSAKCNLKYWFYGHFHTSKTITYNNTIFKVVGIDQFYHL
jgi:Icc-related predicted phosphoesterase